MTTAVDHGKMLAGLSSPQGKVRKVASKRFDLKANNSPLNERLRGYQLNFIFSGTFSSFSSTLKTCEKESQGT